MKKLVVLFLGLGLVLVLISSLAFAEPLSTAILVWTSPTATVDGLAITADTAITGYKVFCGQTTGVYTVTKITGIVPEQLASGMPLTVGTWYCVVAASNKYGDSAKSVEKTFTLEGSVPMPPTNLIVK